MLSIDFAPLVALELLLPLVVIGMLAAAYGIIRRARGIWWRTLAILGLAAGLANPVLVEEERSPRDDIAIAVVDMSASQKIGERAKRTEAALEKLRRQIEDMQGVELRVVRAGGPRPGAKPVDGTLLFEALGQAASSVPTRRMAGTFLITDGQVHDVPGGDVTLPVVGPVHVMLTGERDERDRMLVVEEAPRFGLVGKPVTVRVRVEDPAARGRPVRLSVTYDDKPPRTLNTRVGETIEIPITLEHAGANIVQIEVEAGPEELTEINNRGVVQINGVRERLRVLLVSGEPHPGERMWRNLLKADPSVDLVHFTILRPPEKQDSTPVRELSLIAFPIRELFEEKLNDFDLIIFDRYRRRGVLPSIYLHNIVDYIRKGGAVLEAAGPSFATPLSLHRTPLGSILPGAPTGKIIEQGLKPKMTDTGLRHPVTADLVGAGDDVPPWGRWFRQIEADARAGYTLMSGANDRPLLIVDRIGEGRVAQLLSDHIWLWERGFEEGGPQAELLRRLSHWLMKEPDLEENDLRAQVEGDALSIRRRTLEPSEDPVQVTLPSGETRAVEMKAGVGGRDFGKLPIEEIGIYRITDGDRTALAAVGNLNPREYADMRTSETPLNPLVERTGGGTFWLADGLPDVRQVRPDRTAAGRSWAGLVANGDYSVASVREVPMLPALLLLLLALGAIMLAWRREGR